MADEGVRSPPDLTLRYLGHASFQWTSPAGVRVLIDPFDDPENGRWFVRAFPPVETDLLLVTHAHFDHDAVHRVPGTPTILRGRGEFRRDDVSIRAVNEVHSTQGGRIDISNIVFLLQAGGVRFCHVGDNRVPLANHALEALGRVDVLMAPVDESRHLIEYDEVGSLIESLGPRVVIPMHYFIPGLTHVASTLQPVDGWLALQPRVRRLDTHTLTISPEDLPGEREVWVFRSWAAC